jgi:hypothetical protein
MKRFKLSRKSSSSGLYINQNYIALEHFFFSLKHASQQTDMMFLKTDISLSPSEYESVC